jgi:uncharacterized protein
MDSLYFKRELESRLQFIPGLPVLVIVGARRVGKTTLLRGFFERTDINTVINKVWLDGDNPASLELWERLRTGQDPLSWLETLAGRLNQTQEVMLFLDEAQALPDSSKLVKVLVDKLPFLRVVMSGSSALKLRAFSNESMAGRKQVLELYPLNLRERLSDPKLPKAGLREFSVPGILREMLVWGGFPNVLQTGETWQRTSYLVDILDSLLYRDLLSELRGKDVSLLKRLLVALARSVGSRVNISKLGGLLELSRPTILRYLTLLEESSVITLLPGIDGRGVVAKAQPKVYFLDNGILSLLLADERIFEVRKPEDQGLLLENFVVTELIKRYAYSQDRVTQLGYLWVQGSEVDIVAYKNGALQQGWEVKLTSGQGGSREAREVLGEARLEVVNLLNIAEILS